VRDGNPSTTQSDENINFKGKRRTANNPLLRGNGRRLREKINQRILRKRRRNKRTSRENILRNWRRDKEENANMK
jgi:hypothetical protein